jgi:uncharacterized RDD family membrane protein YckC
MIFSKDRMLPYLAENKHRLYNFLVDSSIVLLLFGTVALMPNENAIFLALLVQPLYYLLIETYSGKTVGKYVTNTSVYMNDGKIPTKKAIAIRTLCRFIPFEWVTYLIGKQPICLHDKLSKTIVVEDRLI